MKTSRRPAYRFLLALSLALACTACDTASEDASGQDGGDDGGADVSVGRDVPGARDGVGADVPAGQDAARDTAIPPDILADAAADVPEEPPDVSPGEDIAADVDDDVPPTPDATEDVPGAPDVAPDVVPDVARDVTPDIGPDTGSPTGPSVDECMDQPLPGDVNGPTRLRFRAGTTLRLGLVRDIDPDLIGTAGTTVYRARRFALETEEERVCLTDDGLHYTNSHHNFRDVFEATTAASDGEGAVRYEVSFSTEDYGFEWTYTLTAYDAETDAVLWGPVGLSSQPTLP